jgi:hypothetical protein
LRYVWTIFVSYSTMRQSLPLGGDQRIWTRKLERCAQSDPPVARGRQCPPRPGDKAAGSSPSRSHGAAVTRPRAHGQAIQITSILGRNPPIPPPPRLRACLHPARCAGDSLVTTRAKLKITSHVAQTRSSSNALPVPRPAIELMRKGLLQHLAFDRGTRHAPCAGCSQ